MTISHPTFMSLIALEEDSSVSRFTWRRWLRAGRLPMHRIGRKVCVRREDYDAFIAAQRVAPAAGTAPGGVDLTGESPEAPSCPPKL